jgi:hypothetical protein
MQKESTCFARGKESLELNNLKAIKDGAKVLVPPLTIEIQREPAIFLPRPTAQKHLSALGKASEIPLSRFPTARSILGFKSLLQCWKQLPNLFMAPLPTTVCSK